MFSILKVENWLKFVSEIGFLMGIHQKIARVPRILFFKSGGGVAATRTISKQAPRGEVNLLKRLADKKMDFN